MRYSNKPAALALLMLLVACGGPSGPLAPQAATLTPPTAVRGGALTITGTNFGSTAGSVTIGGVDAVVSDWTDTTIEATVPSGSANAWQDIVVTTSGGSSTLPGLFVGVEFDGAAAELQDFLDGQALGTAVLLAAAEYDLAAEGPEFVIDNKDLYGRGQDTTKLLLPNATTTVVMATFGESTTIADLTIVGNTMSFLHGTVSDTVLPTNVNNPHVILERFTFDKTIPGMWGPSLQSNVDFTMRDSTLNLETGAIMLSTGGDIRLERVEAIAVSIDLHSLLGSLELQETSVTAANVVLAAESGLAVVDSSVRATDGSITILGAAQALIGGSTAQLGGPVEVVRSTLESLDADLADASVNGWLSIITQFAPITLLDNELIRTHADLQIETLNSFTGEADIELAGNLSVRAGVFESEDPVNYRPAVLHIQSNSSNLRDRVTLTGNSIATTQTAAVHAGGTSGDMVLEANDITVGDVVNGVLVLQVNGIGTIEATNNDITASEQMIFSVADLDAGTLSLADNRLVNSAETPGILYVQGAGGSCELTGNEFNWDDPSDSNTSTIVVQCSTSDPLHTLTVSDNDITAIGNSGSTFMLAGGTEGNGSLSGNSITTDGPLNLQLSDLNASVTGNTVVMAAAPFIVTGSAETTLDFTNNVVQQADTSDVGLVLTDVGSATLVGNVFKDEGTPAPDAVAFIVAAAMNPVTVTATANTFAGYSRALVFEDLSPAALGISAAINGNVFDFDIDAAPEVAELLNVKDEIDATNNQWGSNTLLATVQGYVTLAGDTAGQGGSILLDPIRSVGP